MAMLQRIERVLEASLVGAEAKGSPPKLGQAMRHAVFPGGARIRPQLCMAVALACGMTTQAFRKVTGLPLN